MSGYFAALIRSSGIAVGASATTAQAGATAVETERASSAHPGLEAGVADHEAGAKPGSPATSPSPATRAPAAATPLAVPVGRAFGAVEPPSPATRVRSAEATQPDPPCGDSRVRAALQWIAADPLPERAPARRAASTTRASLVRAQERDDGDAEANASPPVARLASPAQPVAGERERVRAVAAASLHAHDEVTEISIGAIHLRVDAPAAQTVVHAPAPSPATLRAPAASARLSLARRALRRI